MTMSRRHESVFDDPDVTAELAEIHEKFVVKQTRHLIADIRNFPPSRRY